MTNQPIVNLKEEFETSEFKNTKGELVIPFGRDIYNRQWNVDLFELPHLLMGGSTGSGKSVFLHSLLVTFLTQHTPDTLRLILADPKRVEFTSYNGLPHLLFPVILDYNKICEAVNWCIDEMDRRFDMLIDHGFSNIKEYNKNKESKMPFIIFAIDEMADFSYQDKNNKLIKTMIKILQMGKGVGIHLIVGTSRPHDKVYPGVFNGYFTARLAFATATKDNSEVILGIGGAESLLGRGDSLFWGSSMPKPVRLQMPFISYEEIDDAMIQARTKQRR